MAVAAKDDNGVSTLIGVSSDDGVTPTRAKVDPVTGYLLIYVVSASVTPTLPSSKIDDNNVRVGCGVANNAGAAIMPFLSDPNNAGHLLVDIA